MPEISRLLHRRAYRIAGTLGVVQRECELIGAVGRSAAGAQLPLVENALDCAAALAVVACAANGPLLRSGHGTRHAGARLSISKSQGGSQRFSAENRISWLVMIAAAESSHVARAIRRRS
jgi:hypothetical protein